MVKGLKKFGGAIIFYAVIFFGVIAIASRIDYLKDGYNNIGGNSISINK